MPKLTKMPLEQPGMKWLFKKSNTCAAEMALLMTPLSGKVFQLQEKISAQKQAKKNTKDAVTVLTEGVEDAKPQPKKASAKAKSKGKAKAKAGAKTDVIEDSSKLDSAIIINSVQGGQLVRDKYFVDCLVLAVRSALHACRRKWGLIIDADGDTTDAAGTGPMSYVPAEYGILEDCVRRGIFFACERELVLDGKRHTKWSTLRPQLQVYVMNEYRKAG